MSGTKDVNTSNEGKTDRDKDGDGETGGYTQDAQEYLGVPPPTPEEQSSLYLPILPKGSRKALKHKSLHPPPIVVRSTLGEENTVSRIPGPTYPSFS